MVETLTAPPSPMSLLDPPDREVLTWPDCDEHRRNLTVGGDYALPPETQDADDELRAWVKGARRSVARWARENPY